MNKKHKVNLSDDQRVQLLDFVKKGKAGAREIRRAHTLLMADSGSTDEAIARTLHTSINTVSRTRQQFCEENLESTLSERPRSGKPSLVTDTLEAYLIATTCSKAPEGSGCWTLKMLADRMVSLEIIDTISTSTISRTLRNIDLKPWLIEQWCIPQLSSEYVYKMEDVLDVYAQPPDARRPLVCFDERLCLLIENVHEPIPPKPKTEDKPGQKEKIDYEYERNGTCNLFAFLAPHLGWRHVKVTDRRTKVDFAYCMKELVDVHFPEADVIKLVMDNLNTHTIGALYEVFEPAEARRIAQKLEIHHTPKHGSWLNMVESELSVLVRQCLNRRLPNIETLKKEVSIWEENRNENQVRVNWRFRKEDARIKLKRVYPTPQN
ncbi:IS630 family transposase [Dulcicalothrix desertica PCC 7102]|uniref:IS630 family transposase n=2 Tax=Dulcicalothrix desertica TaxID=32056 RepID=A0A3S1BVK0_9CYAN|nr:IS630 family transposase [Dulcicalothrix desertica]RUS92248.1 IS630 family transposase [Dulcicalothrix desertica PCC 7102]RUS99404.1 IS630 family transposase [Dulcicalothrix desertica PCC 7102]TWH39703.1 homeodomain-containing protein [Dulcicalothrix desertica PCC 7102]TWH49946.1 homeodomain-containing protein [Dulcicalothrix desertica PCC 7102]